MNISLPGDLKRWLDEQVKAGDYGTASEYVRDMLRRTRERQLRRRVDGMLSEAMESGANTVMDEADWSSIRTAARAAVAKPKRTKR
jgi:antitoxin ParD1/3/4